MRTSGSLARQADPASVEAGFFYFNEDHSDYESWWGVKSLPKLNWASAALREAFVTGEDSVVAHWLKAPFNLDGWRIDVGNMTGRLGAQDINKEVAALIQDRVSWRSTPTPCSSGRKPPTPGPTLTASAGRAP